MSRYIDVNLIEECKEMADDSFEWGTYVVKMSAIRELPTAEVKPIVSGEWVSVKEKLPKDGVDVLAYLESGEYVIRHIVEVFGYKEWSGGQIGERTHNVIAWQPLPAPYKESEE